MIDYTTATGPGEVPGAGHRALRGRQGRREPGPAGVRELPQAIYISLSRSLSLSLYIYIYIDLYLYPYPD